MPNKGPAGTYPDSLQLFSQFTHMAPEPRPSCLRHTLGGCEHRRGPARCQLGIRFHSWLEGSKRSRSEVSCSTWGRKNTAEGPHSPYAPQPDSPGLPCLSPARALNHTPHPIPQSPGLPLWLPHVCPLILTGLGWEVCGAGQPSP